jgi:hypothetical protein
MMIWESDNDLGIGIGIILILDNGILIK